MDFICKILRSEAPDVLKDLLDIKAWPLVAIIVTAIVMYLLFGPGAQILQKFIAPQYKKNGEVEISHS